MLKAAPAAETAAQLGHWRIPFPGGLRFAHVHLDDRIFALNDEQWKEFSTSVVDDMKARLDRAGSVSVHQLTELSESILELSRISHTLSATAADLLASTTFLAAAPPATCLKHDSAPPWSKRRADKHLRSLATKVCEICGL